MNTNEKEVFRLTADEAEYIEDLIMRNEYVIRAAVKLVLREKFEQVGEDCISEICVLACKKIAILKKHENPDAWIAVASRKVAQNVARKHTTITKKTRHDEITDKGSLSDVFEDAVYNIWMEDGAIDKLLNTLTPHEREIYDLIYKRRLTAKTAADSLGISASTVRNTVAIIKRKIKSAVETKLF